MRSEIPHVCAVSGCGNPVVRKPGERLSRWRERKTCSDACRIKATRDNFQATMSAKGHRGHLLPEEQGVRHCVACNREIPRRKGISWKIYSRRTTCGSDACRHEQVRSAHREEMSPAAVLQMMNKPSPKAVHYARHCATGAELRLMAPEIRAAAGLAA